MAENLGDFPSATALKIATARQKKDTADEAFKSGKVKDGAYLCWRYGLQVVQSTLL